MGVRVLGERTSVSPATTDHDQKSRLANFLVRRVRNRTHVRHHCLDLGRA